MRKDIVVIYDKLQQKNLHLDFDIFSKTHVICSRELHIIWRNGCGMLLYLERYEYR